jgi:hypothetical protein
MWNAPNLWVIQTAKVMGIVRLIVGKVIGPMVLSENPTWRNEESRREFLQASCKHVLSREVSIFMGIVSKHGA